MRLGNLEVPLAHKFQLRQMTYMAPQPGGRHPASPAPILGHHPTHLPPGTHAGRADRSVIRASRDEAKRRA